MYDPAGTSTRFTDSVAPGDATIRTPSSSMVRLWTIRPPLCRVRVKAAPLSAVSCRGVNDRSRAVTSSAAALALAAALGAAVGATLDEAVGVADEAGVGAAVGATLDEAVGVADEAVGVADEAGVGAAVGATLDEAVGVADEAEVGVAEVTALGAAVRPGLGAVLGSAVCAGSAVPGPSVHGGRGPAHAPSTIVIPAMSASRRTRSSPACIRFRSSPFSRPCDASRTATRY